MNIKKILTYIVDSFTDLPFRGNPAGVCLLDNKIDENKMLNIANELGLSETAFLYKLSLQDNYSIRFFSPKMEILLCGHATMAAAKVLFQHYFINEVRFVNVNNLELYVKKEGEFLVMEFPVYDTKPQEAPLPLLSALGITKIINSEYNKETNILLIEIDNCKLLNELSPDFELLKRSHNTINGVLITSISSKPNYDFESRYFWPWSGSNEDPVTGATHTFLANYWKKKLNKSKMNSFQCSKRSGFMEVEIINNQKLIIKSKARIVLKGEFYL